HVGVGRGAVEVEVVFLHVLAVVALGIGEAEGALLDDRIDAVPEGEGKAEPLLVVRDAEEAVLAPAVGAGAGVIVGEIVPGAAVLAVVLAAGAPLPLGQVRAPSLPGNAARRRLFQPRRLGAHRPDPVLGVGETRNRSRRSIS